VKTPREAGAIIHRESLRHAVGNTALCNFSQGVLERTDDGGFAARWLGRTRYEGRVFSNAQSRKIIIANFSQSLIKRKKISILSVWA
jgi:hypothetical protein